MAGQRDPVRHYGRLRDDALDVLGTPITGRTLQVACVYGNLTARLRQRMADDARLDVVDTTRSCSRSVSFASRRARRRGTAGWRALRSPWSIVLHALLLVAFVVHAQSWFATMLKTMPMIFVGGRRLAAATITRAGWGGDGHRLDRTVRPGLAVGIVKRSNAPIFWLPFGAGGILSALLGTMLVFITGIAVPLGWPLPATLLSYPRMLGFAQHWAGKGVVCAVIALFTWHAAHRIVHSLHDVGVHATAPAKLACYLSALVVTLVAAGSLVSIGF